MKSVRTIVVVVDSSLEPLSGIDGAGLPGHQRGCCLRRTCMIVCEDGTAHRTIRTIQDSMVAVFHLYICAQRQQLVSVQSADSSFVPVLPCGGVVALQVSGRGCWSINLPKPHPVWVHSPVGSAHHHATFRSSGDDVMLDAVNPRRAFTGSFVVTITLC